MKTDRDERVLVLALTARDATLSRTILTEAGLACFVCADTPGLCREFAAGAGVILLTEDGLAATGSSCLAETLGRQPAWSDIPVLLLCGSGADSPVAAWAMEALGNVTVLERPVRLTTLVSALRTALKARRRQYELRDQLEALRRSEESLREAEEKLSNQNERLRLLLAAATVLLSTDDPDAMLRGLFAEIGPHLDMDTYFNFVLNETGDALRLASCFGIPDEAARSIERLEFGQALCGTAAVQRRPIVATHIQQSDDPKAQLAKSLGLRAYACHVLLADDRLIGTLSFASRTKDEFDADELSFLQTITHYVTLAYERLRLIKELREADSRKDEFLATLAHELRNPLAPIRMGLEVLRLDGDDPETMNEMLDTMEGQVRHMVRLIDDLLDVSRITRGKLELKKARVELKDVVKSAVEAVRPLCIEAGHDLTVSLSPEPLILDGDPARLSQVFGNLLTNACRYTPDGGRITLAAERQGSDVVVSVRDNGAGIPPEMLTAVFGMFTQVDRTQERSQSGLGIGLHLVQRLVEMHGGSVEARSEGRGAGSEFVVRLPLVVSPVPTDGDGQARSTSPTACPRRRVLVADDNRDAANSLSTVLRVMGHEVYTAYDGQQAVGAAEAFRPELAILDIGMPRLNGYEAAEHIRREAWGRDILLVALTGWGQEQDKQRSREAGFDCHLVKPIEPTALQELLAGGRKAPA